MKSKKVIIPTLLILVLALVGFFVVYKDAEANRKRKVYQISYICRESNLEESQNSVKMGMEQASKDLGIEIRTISYGKSITEAEQLDLIEREIKDGVDAIIIEPLLEENLLEEINQLADTIPIVELNGKELSQINEKIPCVYTNYQEIGNELINIMAKNYKLKKVYVVKENFAYEDIKEIYEGTSMTIEDKGVEVEVIPYTEDRISYIHSTIESVKEEKGEVILALGIEALEKVGKFVKEQDDQRVIKVFGYGKSNQIISYIEEGVIDYVAVTDEYGIGYLGVLQSVNLLNDKPTTNEKVDYTIINTNNIYTTKNQRLLFPFVQ
ncbi:ribose transport system substrate-binding protein [Aequitasia blattaphilus]|uniref:Substrate-binding domain-containing protein n=1 Tax=Aequitasia blattaphilus TaxID=2949332 RepID=A0ABT1E8P8_9FIRM|nr:substrate-binding domain-containing protein [Aequitasia blattaphilus]MCP1102009.1 substrate-binding domain-containing protein [Aequitasia blattaphilus]MCR8614649.1 substrate-binding domain-containing protein [Aequitasia blattaphilus]